MAHKAASEANMKHAVGRLGQLTHEEAVCINDIRRILVVTIALMRTDLGRRHLFM